MLNAYHLHCFHVQLIGENYDLESNFSKFLDYGHVNLLF